MRGAHRQFVREWDRGEVCQARDAGICGLLVESLSGGLTVARFLRARIWKWRDQDRNFPTPIRSV